MAQLVLDLSDTQRQRVIDAFCGTYDYDVNKNVNETQAAFTRRMHARMVKDFVAGYESVKAGDTARIQRETQVRAELDLQ